MKILKGFALAILCLLLFISLFIFGVAFMVKQTVLNPNFLAAEVKKFPLTEILKQNSAYEMDIPREVKDTLDTALPVIEPQLKQATGDAIKSIYDYLLGKKSNPELATTLHQTILSDSLVNSIIDNIDIPTLVTNTVREQLDTQDIPIELQPLLDRIKPILIKEQPQLKTQLKAVVPPIIDYLFGEINSFNVTFSLDAVVNDLKTEAKTILKNNPPPELAGVPLSQLDAYIDLYITQNLDPYLEDFQNLTIDQTVIGSDTPAQITQALQEAEDALAQVRPYIVLFQRYYIWLIVIMVILAAGIAVINYSVRGATRSLGSVFLAYGIIEFVPLVVIRLLAPNFIFSDILADLSFELAQYRQQAVFDFMSPLWWFSLGCLVAGIALLVVSFI